MNSRGQASEGIVWILATIIIVVILFISISISISMGKGRTLSYQSQADLFAKKTLSSYLLTPGNSGNIVFHELRTEEQFNEFNGNLAVSIFKEFYNREPFYGRAVWLGINFEGFSLGRKNDYFGSYVDASTRKGGDISYGRYDSISDSIYLVNGTDGKIKWIEMVFLSD